MKFYLVQPSAPLREVDYVLCVEWIVEGTLSLKYCPRHHLLPSLRSEMKTNEFQYAVELVAGVRSLFSKQGPEKELYEAKLKYRTLRRSKYHVYNNVIFNHHAG